MSSTQYILVLVVAFALSACGSGGLPDLSQKSASSTVGGGTASGDITVGGGSTGAGGGTGTTGAGAVGGAGGSVAVCDPATLVHPPKTNDQFLQLAYCQFFNRAPDSAGYAYWTNEMNSGYARINVLLSFMLSSETEQDYAISTMSGTQLVTFYYAVYLARTPDTLGLTYWVNRFTALNGDRVELGREFLSTPEPKTYWNM